jgi:L-alanine-DL-glutamate epimerase-like enolase superfamily enzyme
MTTVQRTGAIPRRGFLGLAAAASAAGLAGNDIFAQETGGLTAAARGMTTVKRVEALVLPRSLFVRVETADGVVGWGECTPTNTRVLAALINHELAPYLAGADPFDTEPLWDRMFFNGYELGPSGALTTAIAGIDIALWDIKGKITGLPVSRLMGGVYRSKVRVYATFARGNTPAERKTPLECAREAAGYAAEGFTAVKLRMQIRQMNVDPDPDPTFEYAKELRAALGDGVALLWDCNNGYTPARAITVGRRLFEEYGITHFEEPVSQHNYDALAQVVDAVEVPVAAGEHEDTRWQFRDLITRGRVDVLTPDVIKCGGLTEARKIAVLAQAYDRPIALHNTQPTIATAASVHLAASVPNGHYAQEYRRRKKGINELLEQQLDFNNSYLTVPTGPGLGIMVNEAAVRKEAVQP